MRILYSPDAVQGMTPTAGNTGAGNIPLGIGSLMAGGGGITPSAPVPAVQDNQLPTWPTSGGDATAQPTGASGDPNQAMNNNTNVGATSSQGTSTVGPSAAGGAPLPLGTQTPNAVSPAASTAAGVGSNLGSQIGNQVVSSLTKSLGSGLGSLISSQMRKPAQTSGKSVGTVPLGGADGGMGTPQLLNLNA